MLMKEVRSKISPTVQVSDRLIERRKMTICAAMPCPDGIVLCADTLEAVGSVHREVKKLVELPLASGLLSAVVVCATDDATFADPLIEKISDSLDCCDGTFASAKRAIEDVTLNYCSNVWEALHDPQHKPSADLLVGLKTVDDLRLLNLTTPTVRNTEGAEFIGYGRELAIYKAGQYGLKNMPVDTAAPIIAYIVDIVKNNVQFCGRATDLAILHPDGTVEHKTQDYIIKATQGYKSVEWLLSTWVFPFLPVAVGETGEDLLSLIGNLGAPKTEWVEKIPDMLQTLVARKKAILAGETPRIPPNQARNGAIAGFPLAARLILNSSQKLYEKRLLSEETNKSVSAKYTGLLQLSQLLQNAANKDEIDEETMKEAVEKICLILTTSPTVEQIMFETIEGEPQN